MQFRQCYCCARPQPSKSCHQHDIEDDVGTISAAAALGLYNFKATVAYKGGAYKGWQVQNGSHDQPTIQGLLQRALTQLKKEPLDLLSIQGAGRTDAGVHARGQVNRRPLL